MPTRSAVWKTAWKIGPTVLRSIGRPVGLADLAEDLALAQHQALQAGGDAEQVADDPLVVVADQVPGEQRRRRRRGSRPGSRVSASASGTASGSPAT